MRLFVSIRTQLILLFVLSSVVALAVLSISTWITVYRFVVDLRESRLTLTASLKATQLSLALTFMEETAESLATRFWLRNSLTEYQAGNRSASLLNSLAGNVQSAITGRQQHELALQAIIYPPNSSDNNIYSPLLRATNANMSEPGIRLPYRYQNGSAASLGDAGVEGYPLALYPNLTTGPSTETMRTTVFNGNRLDMRSNILLGPLHTNSTFSLFSITMPITDVNETAILGWITVLLDGRLISEVVQSPVGVGETGVSRIIGPNTIDNRFIGVPNQQPPYSGLSSAVDQTSVIDIIPQSEALSSKHRNPKTAGGWSLTPFNISSYPGAYTAFTRSLPSLNNAGSDLTTKNEKGLHVGVGFADPITDLCDWVILVEALSSELYQPIMELRTVILACVFSTLAFMVILIVPTTAFWTRPIRRLREATEKSIATPSEASEKSLTEEFIDPRGEDRHSLHTAVDGVNGSEKSQMPGDSAAGGFSGLEKHLEGQRSRRPSTKKLPRIPGRVKERKACFDDELTALTSVFNEMSDELASQYLRLDERVKNRTRELEISKKEAESANESKSLFIANISHEIKTPLNGILGMASVTMGEKDPARVQDALSIIMQSADLLHSLLNDLLNFSKNRAGKNLVLDEKQFCLRNVATQIHAIFDNQAFSKEVTLLISYENTIVSGEPESSPRRHSVIERMKSLQLYGDEHRVLQVVINFVSNGLKFTPRGGLVHLHIRQLEEPSAKKASVSSAGYERDGVRPASGGLEAFRDLFSVNRRNTDANTLTSHIDPLHNPEELEPSCWFEFEVQDTGPGIEESMQQKIFEPFVQVDSRLSKNFGGTGLGLSICKQLSKLLRGDLRIESETGKGSSFFLKVPLRIMPSDRTSSLSSAPSISVKEETLEPDMLRSHTQDTTRRSSLKRSINASDSVRPRLVGLSQPFLANATPPLASPSIEGQSGSSKGVRVLVAEDNHVNQEVIRRMLGLENLVDISVASNGKEAYERVRQSIGGEEQFDFIFMDIQMPIMDGRESTKLIRETGFSRPIVALTAFTDAVNERECYEAGMNLFLAKPIKRAALKEVLKKCSISDGEKTAAESAAGPFCPIGSPASG